jgi:hypothetical protein
MSGTPSATRRLAVRLVRHAGRVLPGQRADFARAMAHEVEHLPDDGAALRWAAGTVVASYFERCRDIDALRSFMLSALLVGAGLLVIEGAHLLLQYLLQDRIGHLLLESIPASYPMTASGSYARFSILLTLILFAPLTAVAYVLARNLIRWVPQRARPVIKATILMDAAFVASAILINVLFAPDTPVSASTSLLWLIRVLLVTLPMVLLLRSQHRRLDLTRV